MSSSIEHPVIAQAQGKILYSDIGTSINYILKTSHNVCNAWFCVFALTRNSSFVSTSFAQQKMHPRILEDASQRYFLLLEINLATESSFLNIVNVEPVVNDTSSWKTLRNVTFKKNLKLNRHFTDPFVA